MGKSMEVKNLVFTYGNRVVLDNISFKVNKSSITTIIGPNGSGKSTLLKNLAATLFPKEGHVFLDNRELKSYSQKELAREIAVVPQNTNIEYDFTVHEIVLMGRNPYIRRFYEETTKDFAIVQGVMERTDIWCLKDRSINELSGGERQRVIIARALAQEPNILLLDEPTSTLDIHQQIEILDLLKELNNDKSVTIIMVLHDINLAARYSNEILLLNKGKKVIAGNPELVITKDNLQKAYNIDMVIEKNQYTKSLNVIPLSNLKL